VLAAAVSDGSTVAALVAGVAVGAAALAGLMKFQRATWQRAVDARLFEEGDEEE
jgi:hypothetical protein